MMLFALCLVVILVHTTGGVEWPSGKYGLPKPKSGCPENWMEGRRFTNAEELNSNSRQFKDWFHLSGFVSTQGVEQEFCTKTSEEGSGEWPSGRYCILKGGKCPHGLVEGYIHWRDKNYLNRQYDKTAVIPQKNKKVEYCCNANGEKCNDLSIQFDLFGKPAKPIVLPLTKPFYLYAYGSSDCQVVKGAQVKKELVHFEMNTRTFHQGEGGAHPFEGGLGNSNHRLTYCYYTPVKTQIIQDGGQEVEKAFFTNEELDNKSQSSALAVAIGVGVACALMGTATIAFFAKRLIKRDDDDDDDDTPRPDDN